MAKADPAGAHAGREQAEALAEALVRRAPQDVVFTMTIVGESRQRLLRFFEDLIREEIERRGGSPTRDLVRPFIDEHAAHLRDFVLTGAALSRQFRLEQIEALLGDRTMLTRVDLWDTLAEHIRIAADRFRAQADDIPALLADLAETRERMSMGGRP